MTTHSSSSMPRCQPTTCKAAVISVELHQHAFHSPTCYQNQRLQSSKFCFALAFVLERKYMPSTCSYVMTMIVAHTRDIFVYMAQTPPGRHVWAKYLKNIDSCFAVKDALQKKPTYEVGAIHVWAFCRRLFLCLFLSLILHVPLCFWTDI